MDSGPSKNPSLSEQAPRNPFTYPHQVSKAARQEKRFQDYNERCTFHHQARVSHGQWVIRGDCLGRLGRELHGGQSSRAVTAFSHRSLL